MTTFLINYTFILLSYSCLVVFFTCVSRIYFWYCYFTGDGEIMQHVNMDEVVIFEGLLQPAMEARKRTSQELFREATQ